MAFPPQLPDPKRPGVIFLIALVLAMGSAPVLRADGDGVPGGIAGMAAAVAQKRQQQVVAAQTLFTAGSRAYNDRSYAEAMDYFKAAFETIPDVPAVAEQRAIFFRRYQSASLAYARILVEEAKWAESEKTLADAVSLAEAAGIADREIDPELKKMLRELREKDDRYNMALSPRHLRNVDLVESKLILGRGYTELGDYDRAERAYNEALNVDPYNTAARRGLEEVERYRMNYYDVAYDHTRAKKLAEIAAAWESPVPELLASDEGLMNLDGVTTGGSVLIEQKLKDIVIPTLEFSDARLADVVEYLVQKAQELDASETDPTKRGVNVVIDSAGAGDTSIGDRTLTVRLSNVPLGVALKYAVQQVGMTLRTDNLAVRIVSPSAEADGALSVRTWSDIPPGFLSGGGGDAAVDSAPADPFANPTAAGGPALVRRVTALEFLSSRGVQFPAGATANYLIASNTLIVRNTSEQLRLIDDIVQASRASSPKMVVVHVRMVSVEQTTLNQLGLDFLLGQSNLGSSPRVFFGGGTNGNAEAASAFDYPIAGPGGPVGTYPVTAGLRLGDVSTGQTITDVINRDSPDPVGGRSPAIFSVAGVFTDPQYQMVLRALSQSKGVDMLCNSHVTTRSGQIAKLQQVREFIYPTEYDPPEIPNSFGVFQIGNTIFEGGDSAIQPATPATPTAFETRMVGKIVDIEPTIAADNKTVSVNVTLDFTDFAGFINYGTPITNSAFVDASGRPSVTTPNEILMPVFDAIKETTSVTIWDGQTVAIGGLHGESITTTHDKVPYLGDLPVLGRAFRSNTNESTKRALTIFVTVNLIDPGGNPLNPVADDEPPPAAPARSPLTTSSFAPGPAPTTYAK